MKNIITALLVTLAASLSTAGIPDGTYTGTGVALIGGQSVSYSVQHLWTNTSITSEYVYPNRAYTIAFSVLPTTTNNYELMMGNLNVGSGYCSSNACHMQYNFTHSVIGQINGQLSAFFDGQSLQIFGINKANGIIFEEVLASQK